MKIGIDVSSLQGPHRMRGIGYTTINILRTLPANTTDHFVFYVHSKDKESLEFIKELLTIPTGHYSFRSFSELSSSPVGTSKLRFIASAFLKIRGLYAFRNGSTHYGKVDDLDAFLQLDQGQTLARLTGSAKNYLIGYDLIPYVLETDYLWSFTTARQHGRSRKSALKSAFNRYVYIKKVALNTKCADIVFTISDVTKHDFMKFADAPEHKLKTIHLGVTQPDNSMPSTPPAMTRYMKTSWGYLPTTKTQIEPGKFLLFVGGADSRRKLIDLVAAFNQLKAQGSDLKLVLSGDIMKGPLSIPYPHVQKALQSSAYLDDIYFLGFTADTTRNWLYKNAVAYVFPSVYEGFGLPVLEVLQLEAPVISYRSLAVREVAGDAPIYADDVLSLVKAVRLALSASKEDIEKRKKYGLEYAQRFSWDTTTGTILDTIHEK